VGGPRHHAVVVTLTGVAPKPPRCNERPCLSERSDVPFRVNIPLPGPFSYSAPIGGGRERPAKPMTPASAVLT